jgi:hypothetical protein
MAGVSEDRLIAMPAGAGKILLERGGIHLCALLKADNFSKFSTERGLRVSAERLLTLERLGLFSPLVRLRSPNIERKPLSLPLRDNEWFDRGWAIDTADGGEHWVSDQRTNDSEAYYSRFQIASLDFVLSEYDFTVQLEKFVHAPKFDARAWTKIGRQLFKIYETRNRVDGTHLFRPTIDALCQYISDRYYPHTQTNMRSMSVFSGGFSFDEWTITNSRKWEWEDYARSWNPRETEETFGLTPAKLKHAYEALAGQQSQVDPLSNWHKLVQFVSPRERDRLKGAALAAETMRSGALMLRLLHKELYGEDLNHPNEVYGTIITHMPELNIRSDARRYLEFVVNQFDLNPRPKLTLFLEGQSEAVAVNAIFERYFGASVGTHAIEIIVLGGVDNATGTKDDRFRAILRLVDYLHHHQTFTFLILDNENSAAKLKAAAHKAKSTLHAKRFVTRPEYLKVWRDSFEFDNFSATEIATALRRLAGGSSQFSSADIAVCKRDKLPGAALTVLYRERTGHNLNKLDLARELTECMFEASSRRAIGNRPLIRVLERVVKLAALNPFPTMAESWEYNQTSSYLGKTRERIKRPAGFRRSSSRNRR